MKQLFWKEYRTNFVWFAILAAVSAITAAMTGSSFIGYGGMSPWMTVSTIVSMLVGLNMYNAETLHDEENFVFSRPVRPWTLFAVKVATLLSMILAGVAVAVIAFLVFVPDQYSSLVSTDRLLTGVASSLVFTGVPAIAGFLFSLAGKGTMESLAILAMAWFLLMFASRFGNVVHVLSLVTATTFTLSLVGMMAYIVSRQQSFSDKNRKALYLIGLCVAILFARGVDAVWSRFAPATITPPAFTRWSSFSPQGTYILAFSSHDSPDASEGANVFQVYDADGTRLEDLRFPAGQFMSLVNWVSDDTALFVVRSGEERIKVLPQTAEPEMKVAPGAKASVDKQPEEFLVVLVTLRKDGAHYQQRGLIDDNTWHALIDDNLDTPPDGSSLSPSGEWFMGIRRQGSMPVTEYFVHLKTLKVVTQPFTGSWWQSGNVAVFRDNVGQVQKVKL